MKPLVRASLESADGLRCVDILETVEGFSWAECRRDPEDGHGWRLTGAGVDGFATRAAAERDAAAAVGWLAVRA